MYRLERPLLESVVLRYALFCVRGRRVMHGARMYGRRFLASKSAQSSDRRSARSAAFLSPETTRATDSGARNVLLLKQIAAGLLAHFLCFSFVFCF